LIISTSPDIDRRRVVVNVLESTTSAENKERQRLLVEVLQNQGRLDRVEEFVHEGVVDHGAPPGLPAGAEGVRAVMGAIRQGFPDHDAQVVQMIAEGDLVATYKTFTGTHTGEFFGLAPTGKRGTIRVMDFVRYRDGRVAEHWNVVDTAGVAPA
jgi:predicted ester cyclase